jgi:hypothetical protein
MEMCFVLTRVMTSRDASYVLWASLSHTAASMREVQLDVVWERVYPRQWALKGSSSNPKQTVLLYAMRRRVEIVWACPFVPLQGSQPNVVLAMQQQSDLDFVGPI